MSETQKPLKEYNEGDTYKGELITTLYAAKTEYLIFEGNKSGKVTIATSNAELRKRCSEISPQISLIIEYLITKKEK
jgi:hypothetical protein